MPKSKDRVTIEMDGRRLTASRGQTLLEIARQNGVEIPTLCYHESLAPWGGCRLCVVEVTVAGRTKVMASCVTPAQDGMVVRTASQRIVETRKMIISLLLSRCPEVELLKKYAREYGVKKVAFEKAKEDCFLCGMCIRACQEIVGVGAIGLANRGIKTKVESPFGIPSSACIGCGTCVIICPARSMKLEKVFAKQTMHRSKVTTIGACKICEDYYSGA